MPSARNDPAVTRGRCIGYRLWRRGAGRRGGGCGRREMFGGDTPTIHAGGDKRGAAVAHHAVRTAQIGGRETRRRDQACTGKRGDLAGIHPPVQQRRVTWFA